MAQESDRRTVVVTGASAGVGRATAVEFARHGWRVGLVARGQEGLEGAAEEVRAAGGEALVLPADVSEPQAVKGVVDRVVSEWGGVDVWVNCAMVTVYAPVSAMSAAEYRRVTDVTYLGYVHGTMFALEDMRRRGRGTIVQVGSALAYRAIPLQSAYCAAKFAIRGFTDALRSELIHEGSPIRVTMVQLPAVNTPQFDWARNRMPQRPQPVPPIYQPEAVAREIYKAALDAPREVWIGGSTVKAILGNMLAPGLLDRLLARKARKGQMSEERRIEDRPDNLVDPVDAQADFGAHGRFDRRAADRAMAVSSTTVRAGLGLAILGVATGAVALLAGSRPLRHNGFPSLGRRHGRLREARRLLPRP